MEKKEPGNFLGEIGGAGAERGHSCLQRSPNRQLASIPFPRADTSFMAAGSKARAPFSGTLETGEQLALARALIEGTVALFGPRRND